MKISSLLNALRVELGLELIAGAAGLGRKITGPGIQKSGLALAGFNKMVNPGLIQVLGQTEIDYLWSLAPKQRREAADNLILLGPPGIVVSRSSGIPEQLVQSADMGCIPLMSTGLRATLLIDSLHKYMANRMARIRSIHGVLVEVFGIGILLIGKSGIGKSECAMELVMRGHRLVADDVVDVNYNPPSSIVGAGNELIRHNMEIRGLGIINIKDLFGVSAICESKKIELVVNLEDWDNSKMYDRLGIVTQAHNILGVAIPRIDIPVRPGRSLTSIIEVAARNQILKVMGHHSALEFQSRIDANVAVAQRNSSAPPEQPYRLPAGIIDDSVEDSS
ncbi:MAG: HPr(Ser) kinase/phosphatase [Deltaproteobacteria bacterium]|nr:HPr(Ser) kinase/phosphatase [Deltaproteobacteria bacterium]